MMTTSTKAPQAHRIGDPILLTDSDIAARRERLIAEYGDPAVLRKRKMRGIISLDEFIALQRFDELDYLEGK